MFLENIPFLPHNFRAEVKELLISVGLNNLATSMMLLFEPVFLYELGLGLTKIMMYYAVLYSVYFFILPLGAKVASRFGFEHTIMIASPFFVLYLVVLIGASYYQNLVWVAAIIFALNKCLYWPAFHANFARYSDKENRGREMSLMSAISMVLVIIGPLLGGLVLNFLGFTALFILASFLVLISAVPLFRTKEEFTPTKFPYNKPFKMMITKANRRDVVSYFGFAEEIVSWSLWPLFIFITFSSSFLALGLVSATTLGLSIAMSFYIGFLVDKKKDRSLKNPLTIIYALSWITRAVAKFPVFVFFADLHNRLGKTAFMLPYTSMIYRRANKVGNLKYIMIMEMTLALSKAVVVWGLVVIFLLVAESFTVSFLIAGLLSLLYLIL